ncbi:MAG: DUF4136 domain-containing protein [Gammaproteobacteria bacterium]
MRRTRMISKTLTLVLASASVLFGTPAYAGVNVDWDNTVDFSQFKTFMIGKTPTESDELMTKRIVDDVVSALESSGLSDGGADADLTVNITSATKDEKHVSAVTTGFGPRWGGWGRFGGVGFGGWRGASTMVNVDNVEYGTITVDLVDTSNGNLVWRGISNDTVSNNPDKTTKKIAKAVKKMFKHFPPE